MIEVKFSGETWREVAGLIVDFARAEEPDTAEQPEAAEEKPKPRKQSGVAKRLYGEAPEGKRRRTNEEMAEDREIEELAAALGHDLPTGEVAGEVVMRWRQESAEAAEKVEVKPAISTTPEDRRPPAEPKPAPVVEDAEIVSDEPEQTATKDEVRDALSKLVEKLGMADTIGWLRSTHGYAKLSDVPEDGIIYGRIVASAQEKLK